MAVKNNDNSMVGASSATTDDGNPMGIGFFRPGSAPNDKRINMANIADASTDGQAALRKMDTTGASDRVLALFQEIHIESANLGHKLELLSARHSATPAKPTNEVGTTFPNKLGLLSARHSATPDLAQGQHSTVSDAQQSTDVVPTV